MRFGHDIKIAILAGETHVWPEDGRFSGVLLSIPGSLTPKCHVGLGTQWIPRLGLQQTALCIDYA